MKKGYSGMTGNERLYESGQIDEYYKAVENKDEAQIREILESIEMDQTSIDTAVRKSLSSTGNSESSIKPLPTSIPYPIIAILSLVFFIGVITLLYDKKFIPLAGPFVALATVPVILFVVKWWQLKGLDNISKSLLRDLKSYKEILNHKNATYPAHVPQEIIASQGGGHKITFLDGIKHIESDIQLIEKGQFLAATKALDNLIYLSTENWPAEKDILKLLTQLAQKNDALKKCTNRFKHTDNR